MSASPALQLVPSQVQAWRDAFSRLKPSSPPCPGLSQPAWLSIQASALDFLDRYGAQAVDLGWTALDLFGVHPTAGTLRADHCGALMLSGAQTTGLSADEMKHGLVTYYRNTPGRPVGIPVWEFKW
ncbi:hypothetical protein J2X36_005258 [Methylobacterium sp. BE186]|uniref:hypothetical protein n=1 Tax=Methylobacterium sp. BE186 TaxID=2817715 RepID=UPI002854DE7B|nr:hypothetical protein [Methylobacterium sp. BE186]MDR7040475.1 hypothetical protein [Methylobacterium sp. BE186]